MDIFSSNYISLAEISYFLDLLLSVLHFFLPGSLDLIFIHLARLMLPVVIVAFYCFIQHFVLFPVLDCN